MRVLGWMGVVLAAIVACAFAYAARPGRWGSEPREVVVVARAMTFTAPGGPAGANPTLRLAAGERVRLVLENRDPGMKHDLVAPGVGLRLATLDFGETDRRLFTAPEKPGTYEYFCSFHDRLMRGRMVVE